ncbi:hypothetical protein DES39_0556 [Orbus hercynius]|uniref:Lipoprotein n=1 Tax=Orbus hercynius TaxID=593135 RepID=A0A495RIS6_9GAMM|nr:hypothetical protein [Orbus hercynius]RKS87335.1 hypothetical protein DES39_0556 [Orbus hercynius]
MKKFLLIIIAMFITSCAKIGEKYGIYKLSDEEKITKLVKDADDYVYKDKTGREYKEQLFLLNGRNEFNNKFKKELLLCYNINNISTSGDEACTIRTYILEIDRINLEKDKLVEKENKRKKENDLISKSIKKDFKKDYANHLYFCGQSYTLIEFVINDILMEREYAYAKKSSMGSFNQKYENQSNKTFQYKILQITPNQLNSIKAKFENLLLSNINLYNRQGIINQNSYLTECLNSPKDYIFNYNKIFK